MQPDQKRNGIFRSFRWRPGSDRSTEEDERAGENELRNDRSLERKREILGCDLKLRFADLLWKVDNDK